MPRRKARRSSANSGSQLLDRWKKQTKNLLERMSEERDRLSDRIADLDGRMEQLKTALGDQVSRARRGGRRAKSGTRKRRRAGGRGAISQSIIDSLKPKGSSVPEIISATGLSRAQVQNSLAMLKKSRKVKAVRRGVYKAT